MVFEKTSEKYFDKEYFDKYKYDESNAKSSVHLRLPPKIANEFVKVIAVYRGLDIDKFDLIKADLGAVIIKDFVDNLPDDEFAIFDLYGKIKAYRDGV